MHTKVEIRRQSFGLSPTRKYSDTACRFISHPKDEVTMEMERNTGRETERERSIEGRGVWGGGVLQSGRGRASAGLTCRGVRAVLTRFWWPRAQLAAQQSRLERRHIGWREARKDTCSPTHRATNTSVEEPHSPVFMLKSHIGSFTPSGVFCFVLISEHASAWNPLWSRTLQFIFSAPR